MTEAIAQVIKPLELTRVGTRSVSAYGYRVDLVKQHLENHQLDGNWCDVRCLARVMFGRDSESNRGKVRKNTAKTFRTLLVRYGLFMAIEYDTSREGRGRILAFKFYDGKDEMERQCAETQLERMHRRKQVTDEMMVRAKQVIG